MPPLALPDRDGRRPIAPVGAPPRCSRARASSRSGVRARRRRAPSRSRRSADASTGCRWRSSSRRLAAGSCHAGEIAERLDGALGALGDGARDAPARQRTLRATIDWSHELLSDDEKALLRALRGVRRRRDRRGGRGDHRRRPRHARPPRRQEPARAPPRRATPDPARDARDDPRVRASSASRPPPTRDAVRERHYRHYLALARHHGTDRRCGAPSHREHLALLDAEIENLHAALRWAVRPSRRTGARAVRRARPLLAVRKSQRARAGVDRPGAGPARRRRASRSCASACFASRPGACVPLGLGREQPAVTAEAESTATALQDPVLLSRVLQIRSLHESAHLDRLDVADGLAVQALRWASIAKDDWTIASAAYARALAAEDPAEVRTRSTTRPCSSKRSATSTWRRHAGGSRLLRADVRGLRRRA